MHTTTAREVEAPDDVETIGFDGTQVAPSETPEDLANLFDQGAGVEKDGEDAPSLESFAFAETGEGQDEAPTPLEIDAPKPKRKYTRRRRLGPAVDPELEALFTEAGIGAVAASGLDGFFRVCAAPPMSDAEKRNVEKVIAYYAQQRMPKEASKYQPEILLGLMLSFIVIPRLGPIAHTTGPIVRPFFSRVWSGIRRVFSRRKNAE